MPTILFISPYWKEEHRWMASSPKLAELWQRLGYRVVVVCMGSVSSVETVSPTLTIHRRKDWFLRDPLNFGISLGFGGYVRRLIYTEKPALIVYNKVLFWSSFGIPFLRLLGHKVTVVTDALVGITWFPRGWLPRLVMRVGGWTMGWLILLCAEHITFFHPQPEAILRRLGIFKKSCVIPTGIDVAAFPPRVPSHDCEHVTLVYVGRLESVKGVDDFLAASVPLKKEYPGLTIRVIGWYRKDYPLVAQYGQDVSFEGLRLDIPEALQTADIFVLPSYSEGLSNALMEAMASTCACIATDVGGNAFLLQNGVSGLLFPAGDRQALRAHVRRLIDDPHKRVSLALAARKRIEERFSWDTVGNLYRALFLDILGEKA